MIYAKDENGNRIKAPEENKESEVKALRAICPNCDSEVIAKCGEIKIHHWAHIDNINCGGEPETEWHIQWKLLAEQNGCEIEKTFGNEHRADAIKNNEIFEFQKKLDTSIIKERLEYYSERGFNVNFILDFNNVLYHNMGNYIKCAHCGDFISVDTQYYRLQKIKKILNVFIDENFKIKFGRLYFDFGFIVLEVFQIENGKLLIASPIDKIEIFNIEDNLIKLRIESDINYKINYEVNKKVEEYAKTLEFENIVNKKVEELKNDPVYMEKLIENEVKNKINLSTFKSEICIQYNKEINEKCESHVNSVIDEEVKQRSFDLINDTVTSRLFENRYHINMEISKLYYDKIQLECSEYLNSIEAENRINKRISEIINNKSYKRIMSNNYNQRGIEFAKKNNFELAKIFFEFALIEDDKNKKARNNYNKIK